RVTIIDPAAERPRLAGGTEVVLLERAKLGRHGPLVGRRGGEEDFRFQVAQEQDVAVLLEPAAAAAGDAHRACVPNLAVHVAVEFLDAAVQFAGHPILTDRLITTESP